MVAKDIATPTAVATGLLAQLPNWVVQVAAVHEGNVKKTQL